MKQYLKPVVKAECSIMAASKDCSNCNCGCNGNPGSGGCANCDKCNVGYEGFKAKESYWYDEDDEEMLY